MKEIIKEPILNLLLISVISALILYMAANTKFVNTLKLLCSLFMLLAIFNIISPLVKIITDITFDTDLKIEEPSTDELSKEALITESAKYISRYTEELIISKFGLSKDDISVSTTLTKNDVGEISIKNATVEFFTASDIDHNAVAHLVSDTLLCECIVLKKE